jgi:hypothetical protein
MKGYSSDNMKIRFFCRTCQNQNKHRFGRPGYEIQVIEFSFSEIVNHMIERKANDDYQHEVDMVIEDEPQRT